MSTEKAPQDWNIGAVGLDAYLRRIGHAVVAPTPAALASLTEAHVRAIPFENLDVVLERHRGLALDAIVAKLVDRSRGGYCFEHNLLFAAVLERLGFTVRRRLARPRPEQDLPRTHMTLIVTVDGTDYLTDVGWGAMLLYPMPLHHGATVDQGGWEHRIDQDGPQWILSRRSDSGWESSYAFDEQPPRWVDFAAAHHYTSTHPESPFTGQVVVQRLRPGLSRRLVRDRLTVEHAGRPADVVDIEPDRLESTLVDLGVVLDEAELDALRQL